MTITGPQDHLILIVSSTTFRIFFEFAPLKEVPRVAEMLLAWTIRKAKKQARQFTCLRMSRHRETPLKHQKSATAVTGIIYG